MEKIASLAVKLQRNGIACGFIVHHSLCILDVSSVEHYCPVSKGQLQLCRSSYTVYGLLCVLSTWKLNSYSLFSFDGDYRLSQTHLVDSFLDYRLSLLHRFGQLLTLQIGVGLHNDVNSALDVESQLHPVLDGIYRPCAENSQIPTDSYYYYEKNC